MKASCAAPASPVFHTDDVIRSSSLRGGTARNGGARDDDKPPFQLLIELHLFPEHVSLEPRNVPRLPLL